MLNVQKFLIDNNKDFSLLEKEFGIKVTEEEHHVLLKYDQLNSPKMNPIVQECRGLVLDKHTLDIAAKAFNRFFNYGEALEITDNFQWDKELSIYEKVDGSLAIVWYDMYKNEWRFNTSGSFGDSELALGKSWSEWMKECIKPLNFNFMHIDYTYVFEFVSPYNKVVRNYSQPEMILLSIFKDDEELPESYVNDEANFFGFKRPIKLKFKNIDEIQKFIKQQEEVDPTFEGVVVSDVSGLRLKIKSSTYLSLHKMKGNGNVFLDKELINFILAGELDELFVYFPEAKEYVAKLEAKINPLYDGLVEVFEAVKDIEDQKTFALKVQEFKTPLSGILFKMKKKYGTEMSAKVLNEEWRASKDLILKAIKG